MVVLLIVLGIASSVRPSSSRYYWPLRPVIQFRNIMGEVLRMNQVVVEVYNREVNFNVDRQKIAEWLSREREVPQNDDGVPCAILLC